MIGFEALRTSLLQSLHHRISNGEITERALARKIGISQPHMHNVLKGVRGMNAAMSDHLLAQFGLTVLDLCDVEELRQAVSRKAQEGEAWMEVPVLKDRLGPGLPWPDQPSRFERVRVPLRKLAAVKRPVVARLEEDRAMLPVLNAGDLIVLDSSEHGQEIQDPDALFAVKSGGGFCIRWVRRGRGRLYLISASSRNHPRLWESVRSSPALVVRARAIPLWTLLPPEPPYDPQRPHGRPRAPARQSAAS